MIRHLFLFVPIFLVGCVGADFVDDRVGSISISPSEPTTLFVGDSIAFTFEFRDRLGQPVDRPVSWALTDDNSIATISTDGLLIASDTGIVLVSAGAESVTSNMVRVEVVLDPGIVTSLVIVTEGRAKLIGDSLLLEAEARNAFNEPVPGVAKSWTSSNTSVATVDANGLVRATGPGNAQISAVFNGLVSNPVSFNVVEDEEQIANVDILNAPEAILVEESVQLSVQISTVNGQIVESEEVVWESSDIGVLQVDANGLITGVASGEATVTASVGNILSQEVMIEVIDPDVPVSIELSVAVNTLMVDDEVQVEAEILNALGEPIQAAISWQSSNSGVATVSASGRVIARLPGMAQITATTVNGLTDVVDIIVEGAGVPTRMGQFMGVNGYRTNGTVLMVQSGSGITLEFSSSFSTSNGPGLYVFLSNSRTSVTSGLQVQRLQRTSGAQTYNVSNVELDQFDFVHVYCLPFGLGFGLAELGQITN